eukprot:TRINITY_DN8150_c3_g1_i1.p1 TRINITY_DN8150_c3_g1~~TRINITY_DN8150_c3_g1_i1.p1  ORF type:complete len:659 (+),score=96.58 TRINITY_DN8150_c3_g1_i1:111-1979(+)
MAGFAASPRKVNLSFTDVTYDVNLKEGVKPILKGVSGYTHAGEMLCVLGPSGGGKTSLIQILAKRISNGDFHKVGGKVLCNGQELTSSQFQRIAGLVTQEDVFNAVLTVQETLMFTARLKLKSKDQRSQVDRVVSMLQLEKCLKTYVGDDMTKGISGGEKRRLAIASEILDPEISVLILDEPTSGLDAAAALNVSNVLRSLADSGMSIISTLHQPRSRLMSRFDQLMVLAAGRPVFYGGLKDYVPYLEQEVLCQVPQHESPYDIFLDGLNPAIGLPEGTTMGVFTKSDNDPESPESPDAQQVAADIAEKLAGIFQNSQLLQKMRQLHSELDGKASADDLQSAKPRNVGNLKAGLTIFMRTFIIKLRDPMVMATQVSTSLMVGVIFGILYWQTYDKEDGFALLDTQMAVTMTVLMSIWLPFDVTLTFPKERQIFLRERKTGMYTTSVFFVARILADMPMHIVAASIMAAIVYPMIGLKMGFGVFLVLNIASVLVGASMMQMIGAISNSFEMANLLMMLVMIMSMMMSTTFVRVVPDWLDWMREISVIGLFGDLAIYLEFKELPSSYGQPEAVLRQYNAQIRDDDAMMSALWILLAIFLVSRFFTFLAVKFLFTGRSMKENLAN